MAGTRVTVTVQTRLLEKARCDVRLGRAKSVSAWIAAAMEERVGREDLARLLADMRAERPSSRKDIAWARAVLDL
jgi:hypothetical protein